MTPAIHCQNLTKIYHHQRALNDLSLRVEQGAVLGFLGPNGAGKTTAMRIMLGLTRPTAGTVSVLDGSPGERSVLARTGALIEAPALYSAMSASQHLRTVAAWAGVPAPRCRVVLEQVGLSDVGSKPTRAFSQGMKQRLGIATALLKEPELLVLDEPANGLDPQGLADLRILLRQLQAQGCTILLSSHMLGEIERVCDHLAVLSAGSLVAFGTVSEVSTLGSAHGEVSALEDAFLSLTQGSAA